MRNCRVSKALCALLIASTLVLALPDRTVAQVTTGRSAGLVEKSVNPRAQDVLDRATPAIIQIKGFEGNNSAPRFHGTGFAASEGGIFITNHHVVSQKITDPERYSLKFETSDGATTGNVEILAIDVANDLAVVRAKGHSPSPLSLEPDVPQKGTKAFSIGYPLNVGLTVTEGVVNGIVDRNFKDRLQYSGALNSGMSGGPVLDGTGRVVGVNAATLMFRQSLNLLIPTSAARALLDKRPSLPPTPKTLADLEREQVRAYSRSMMKAIDTDWPTKVTLGYALPQELAPFVQCQAGGTGRRDVQVEMTSIQCNAKSGVQVGRSGTLGSLRFAHTFYSSEKLGGWRFSHWLSTMASRIRGFGGFGRRDVVGPFACKSQAVALSGLEARVLVCVRAYRDFDGLYDFGLRVVSMNGDTKGFSSVANLSGVAFQDGMSFVSRYLRSVSWSPRARG